MVCTNAKGELIFVHLWLYVTVFLLIAFDFLLKGQWLQRSLFSLQYGQY